MPFFRQRPQRLGQQLKGAHLQCRLTAFSDKTCAFHPDEIPNVQQAKKLEQLRATFFCVNIDLKPTGDVTEIKEVAFSHVAMRSDTTRCTQGFAFLKLPAHLCNRSADFKARTERLDPFRAEGIEFFEAECYQLIFFFDHRRANV